MTTGETSARSKKRSGVNLSSKPLESLDIFIDASLGRKIAEPLRDAGANVFLHDDYFAQGVEDEIWLTEVGKKGWIVLTKDKMIRRRTIEREALINANVKAFVFMSGSIPFSDMAQIFVKALPSINRIASENNPPFIAGIYKDSSVRIILRRK